MAVARGATEGPNDALVAAAQAGDRAAFAILVGRCRETVFAYMFARMRDRDEAEDLTQETFVKAYLALSGLRGAGAWEAWVMRIARNLCHDSLRRQRVRRTEPLDVDWLDDGPSPEALAIAGERRRELARAVAELPEDYQVPLLMHFASGRTYREIAGALNLPQSTVVGRIAGALRRLRRSFEGEGRR